MKQNEMLSKILYPKKTDTFDYSLDVLIALLPSAVAGCIFFGARAVLLLFCCMASAVATEWAFGRILHIQTNIRDLSSLVSGLLIGMTMSSKMGIVPAVVCVSAAVLVTRIIFGGVGCEIVGTAPFGAFLAYVAFPSLSGIWAEPFINSRLTEYTLESTKSVSFQSLFLGAHGGGIGEVGAAFLILGALYLFVRRAISPVMPITFIGFLTVFSLIFGLNISLSLFGGGALLCGIFMLPEPSVAPEKNIGQIVYSATAALLCVVIRRFAPTVEGVYVALAAAQLLRPLYAAIGR